MFLTKIPLFNVIIFFLRFSELRLRQYLGTRYDAIPNVFDWDYNMKLVEKGVRTMTD